jgi:predicted Fe-Mo cluster-binding NifX family protein
MKVAFTTGEKGGLKDIVSDKFGRSPTFTIVEIEDGEVKNVKVVKNPGYEAPSGAGVKAVQKLVDEAVDIVVSGNFGPNSMVALQEIGIKTVSLSGITVEEALKKLQPLK